MAEQHQGHHEGHEKFVAKHETGGGEQVKHAAEQHNQPEHDKTKHVEAAREEVNKEAKPSHNPAAAEGSPKDQPVMYVNRELMQQTWDRTLVTVRRQLSAPKRVLSKVIHQPVVDGVSKVGAVTVARPSGLLGGSIFAFITSSFFLFMSRHYGFRYNYLVFLLAFVGGFIVGIFLELFLFALRKTTKKA